MMKTNDGRILCDSCLESGQETEATTKSVNPDFSGYDLCDDCAAEYDSRVKAEEHDDIEDDEPSQPCSTMQTVINYRNCNAGVPDDVQLDALVEQVMQGWYIEMVEATVRDGVSASDRTTIAETIKKYDLNVSQADGEAALIAKCKELLAEQD